MEILLLAILWGEGAKVHILAYQVLTLTNVRVFSKLATRHYSTGPKTPRIPAYARKNASRSAIFCTRGLEVETLS